MLFKGGQYVQGTYEVTTIARNLSPKDYDEIQFLPYDILDNRSEDTSKNWLYSLGNDWTELDRFLFQGARLPLVFSTLLESVVKAMSTVLRDRCR